MAYKPLPRTITFYRAMRLQLSSQCVNDCDYCPFAGYKPSALPPKKAVRGLIRKGRKKNIRVIEVVSGERVWEMDDLHETLKFFGLPSFDAYLDTLQSAIDEVNDSGEGQMFPVWNVGPLTPTEVRLWRKSIMVVKYSLDPGDPSLWREGALRRSPRKTPRERLAALEVLGRARVPVTIVLNVGIGEGPAYREKALKSLLAHHQKHGHIQSLEISPYQPRTGEHWQPEAPISQTELLEFIEQARATLPREIVLQMRPMNHLEILPQLIEAGIRDFSSFYFTDREPKNVHIEFVIAQIHKYLERMDFRFKERLPLFDRFLKRGWFPDAYYRPIMQFAGQRRDFSLERREITRAIPTAALTE